MSYIFIIIFIGQQFNSTIYLNEFFLLCLHFFIIIIIISLFFVFFSSSVFLFTVRVRLLSCFIIHIYRYMFLISIKFRLSLSLFFFFVYSFFIHTILHTVLVYYYHCPANHARLIRHFFNLYSCQKTLHIEQLIARVLNDYVCVC